MPNFHSFYSLPSAHYGMSPPLLVAPVLNPAFEMNIGNKVPNDGSMVVADQKSYSPQYYQGMFAPQLEDYHKYCQQYYYLMGNDYMQLGRPSIININNVNANGNALIINSRPVTVLSNRDQESSEVFAVHVDREHYRRKYSVHARSNPKC